VIWASKPERKKVLDPGIAFLITDVLGEALRRGTGIAALGEGFKVPAAGKTGTTNQGADAWFVGYTPEIVSGIWIGFDRPRSIIEDATGGRLAAPVWGRVAQRYYQKRKAPETWPMPEGVVARNVDPRSGLILKDGCAPRSGEPRREFFLEEMQPAAWCPGREAPPRNGFPVMRLMEEQRQKEREAAQLAAARRAEEERLRRQTVDQKELALADARKKQEQERLARERKEREAREAKALLAQKQDRQREEQLQDAKRREAERIARIEEEERRLAQREAEIAREERRSRAVEDREQRARDEEARKPAREEVAEREAEAEEEEEEEAETAAASDLSGWWEMTNRIDETNYPQYKGLRLGYRVQLEQDGNRLTGRGQKWTEGGRTIGSSGRTPITVTGTIEGRKVTLNFTEHGVKRSTSGGFTWTLSADRSELRGSFWSTAADTRGRSTAVRMR